MSQLVPVDLTPMSKSKENEILSIDLLPTCRPTLRPFPADHKSKVNYVRSY